jgi:hypothetical protein
VTEDELSEEDLKKVAGGSVILAIGVLGLVGLLSMTQAREL